MTRNPSRKPAPVVASPSRPRRRARVSLAGGTLLPPRLAPRKRPAQSRARTTVDALLQSGAELFALRGYARTTTNDIAERAGVSVGSLYQYFPNKDAILTALLERHLDAVNTVIESSLRELIDPSVGLRDGIRRLLRRLQVLHEEDPQLTRAVEEQVGQVPRLPKAFADRERQYIEGLERMLEARPDVRAGDRRLMASLLFHVAETATSWLAHGPTVRGESGAALEEATEVVCRYLEA